MTEHNLATLRSEIPEQCSDHRLLMRALGILHRFGTEQIGWRGFLRRWYFLAESLRNDAANLVREAGFEQPMPLHTHLVGDREEDSNV